MFVRSHLLVTSLCIAVAAVVWYSWSTLMDGQYEHKTDTVIYHEV